MTTGTITLTLTIGDDGVARSVFNAHISDASDADVGGCYGNMISAIRNFATDAANDLIARGNSQGASEFLEGFRSASARTTEIKHSVIERP